uniref:Protein Wnt n=1 Tax=Macrostomum lignano TaxID=282301 RepID=A0A1I8G448_9PLAT
TLAFCPGERAATRLDQTLILSAQPTCSSIAGLSPKQTLYCQQHFSLMPAVTQGARLGMQECASQFKARRWNCGASHRSSLAFGPVSDDGDLSNGEWPDCARPHLASQMVFQSAIVDCKCHGVSGSCSLKTCWQQLLPFKLIGQRLLGLYDQAAKVKLATRGFGLRLRRPRKGRNSTAANRNSQSRNRRRRQRRQRRQRQRRRRRPLRSELVYIADSPDFCRPNHTLGIEGTRNRQCYLNPEDPHTSCSKLCCQRGYVSRLIKETHKCKCKFEWCCKIHCQQCVTQKVVQICN